MDIQTTIHNIVPYNKNSYNTLKTIIEQSYISLDFFGDGVVSSIGYTGSIEIEHLCMKINELIRSNPDFGDEERRIGFKVQSKLEKLKDLSEHMQANCSRFTAIMMLFKHIISLDFLRFSEPSFYSSSVSDYTIFNYGTQEQCIRLTQIDPKEQKNYFQHTKYFRYRNKTKTVWLLPKNIIENITNKKQS